MEPAILRDFTPADAEWVIERHALLYAREEGYDATFGSLVSEILTGFLRNHDPLRERGWIAEAESERLGSIFCVAQSVDEPSVAKLRLFLLEPAARGTGLAQRMLVAAMDFARAAGYSKMRLWTHASHIAAGRIYARNGFALISAVPVQAFGQSVVDQIWQRTL